MASPDALEGATKHILSMHSQLEEYDILTALLQGVAESLPQFEHVGVSISRKPEPLETTAATTDLVGILDDAQSVLGAGPGVDALHGSTPVVAPRIGDDQRWPQYVSLAVEHGVQSQMAFPLFIDADERGTTGGLNLYSTTSDEISDEDVVLGSLFATNAAAALGKARRINGLTFALQQRESIGQAIGYLAGRYNMHPAAAQQFLWRMSSHRNIKVRDLVAEVLDEANRHTPRVEAPLDVPNDIKTQAASQRPVRTVELPGTHEVSAPEGRRPGPPTSQNQGNESP